MTINRISSHGLVPADSHRLSYAGHGIRNLGGGRHFQHLYWRDMQPEQFDVHPGEGEQAVYEEAIRPLRL